MSLLLPQPMFDVGVGELVQNIEPNLEAIAGQMLRNGNSADTIGKTILHFVPDEISTPEVITYAISTREKVIFYVGSFVKAFANTDSSHDKRDKSILATVHGTRAMAHELKHLAQIEAGTLPVFLNDAQIQADYYDWPWEREAQQAEETHQREIEQGVSEFLLVIALR